MTGCPPQSSRGDWYDSVYERREPAGENVHGEADFVMSWEPGSLLDAGCGTGRVGRELARRGVRVAGFDIDPEMLETARRKGPDLFDAVLMAGNVINFVAPARRHLAVANMAYHLRPGGLLIDGHSVTATEAQLADTTSGRLSPSSSLSAAGDTSPKPGALPARRP
jgi:SAM-dependent methyltransferase